MGGVLKGLKDEIDIKGHAKISLGMGKTTNVTFTARFKKLTMKEAQAKIDRVNSPNHDDDTTDVIREDLIEWRDMVGEGGEVEFNEDNLDSVLNHVEYTAAFFDCWGKAQLGTQLANVKN